MKAPVDGLLVDLDGVLYVGDQLIPGAVATLHALRARGIPYRFITNTTTLSAAALCAKLAAFGLPVTVNHLITAPVATRDYLLREGLTRCYLAVAAEVRADFAGVDHDEQRPQAVVMGDIGDAWSYQLLNRLFGYLLDGAGWWPCTATNTGRRSGGCTWISAPLWRGWSTPPLRRRW
jgi:HAD superfamily hydrolase (TIGR01450 family)